MRLCFGQLSPQERLEKEGVCQRARAAWRCVREGDDARACALVAEIDARVALTVRRDEEPELVHAELTALEAEAWPLAELLLQQAPAELACALSLGRMAVPFERALAEVRESHQVQLADATLRAGFGRGHLLEITLGVPGGTGSENEQNAAENLVRAVLGDRVFDTWVGAVHVTPAPRGGSLRVLDVNAPRTTLRVAELFDTVAAAVRGVLQGLPESSRAEARTLGSSSVSASAALGDDAARGGDWTLLETEPVEAASGVRKDDLVLASTCTPELLRCYLDGSPCASRRFSRTGERFVFVSYEDDERTMRARVARRTALEAALSECVAGEGAVTGVGFGVKTTYVDLALCDLETGLARLVSKLKEHGAPARTFIQFFDSELGDEWLSIWPDSRLTEG
jgi:hypothetical protein